MKYLRIFLLLIVPSFSWASWTATVIGTSTDGRGNYIVSIHFADTLGHVYDVDDHIPFGAPGTQLGDFVATTITNLTNQQVAFSSAPATGFTITPTPPPTPDPNAAIKTQFLSDYLLLKQMQILVNHQVIPATDATLATQLTTVQAELNANRAILMPLIQTGP